MRLRAGRLVFCAGRQRRRANRPGLATGRGRRAARRAAVRVAAQAARRCQRDAAGRRDGAAMGGALGRPADCRAACCARAPTSTPRTISASRRSRWHARTAARRWSRRCSKAGANPEREAASAAENGADDRGPRRQRRRREGARRARRRRQRQGADARPDGPHVGGVEPATPRWSARSSRPAPTCTPAPRSGRASSTPATVSATATKARGVVTIDLGGFTPLLFAARQGDLESGRILLAAGATPNDRAANGASALVVAAHSGQGPFAALLLEKGAEPNAADAGYSALHAAVLRGDLALVNALLARGANPNAPVAKGTPSRYYSKDWALNCERARRRPRRSGRRRATATCRSCGRWQRPARIRSSRSPTARTILIVGSGGQFGLRHGRPPRTLPRSRTTSRRRRKRTSG